jgi:S-adenosylmethionine decarboxylase
MNKVTRLFYSRKSFMFPERQTGPHRGWPEEIGYLDAMFTGGAAYTVGKVNGDHWLLWFFDHSDPASLPTTPRIAFRPPLGISFMEPPPLEEEPPDYTIEILMSKLGRQSRSHFFFNSFNGLADSDLGVGKYEDPWDPHTRALKLSHALGISSIFPQALTEIDAYAFEPCGYSANALIKTGPAAQDSEGYWTIHVTPEEGWSYASFECNVPLPAIERADEQEHTKDDRNVLPNLHQLIQRVVDVFEPANLTVTLFVSNTTTDISPIENAQAVFRRALTPKGYRRTDKITYEFSGYDLAFASFELPTQ